MKGLAPEPMSPYPPAPFTSMLSATPLRAAITALARAPEPDLLPGLLAQATLAPAQAEAAQALALRLARSVRERGGGVGRAGLVQGLLQEFALSSAEGVALMCLAEALLRVPDTATRDALIRDKLAVGDWDRHVGHSGSLFVNAAAWGLMLTGKLVATRSAEGMRATLSRVLARGGEPLIRRGVDMAMRLMGEQFVTGETIGQALANAREREAHGFRFSYDMLGEAALTEADAQRYLAAYEQAIEAIGGACAAQARGVALASAAPEHADAGRCSAGEAGGNRRDAGQRAVGWNGALDGPGISIKLSALHPRYARAQLERVLAELYPRLLRLAVLARGHDIGLNIDAEESDRLELSLELLERLCAEPALAGWNGLGFVIQAYQKRCPAVVDHLVALARRSRRRLMVRLVKGAYWDSEVKRAQVDGQVDYPVYSRKAYTDVAYIACARRLLAAPDAIYPQFATHNAHTLAAVHTLADPARWWPGQYEFQCLHGMGEPLYEQVVSDVADGGLGRPCRIYAPVGSHDTLLAYLVRRLLENGANTSFVHRIADEGVALDELVQDPVAIVQALAVREGRVGLPHPAIALPRALYGARRANSRGLDLADESVIAAMSVAFVADARRAWRCEPLLADDDADDVDDVDDVGDAIRAQEEPAPGPWHAVRNPADPGDRVGEVRHASEGQVRAAARAASRAASGWAATPPAERATCLARAADRLEADLPVLVPLIVREAGRTCANALAEVREAVDFLRYYAAEVRRDFDNASHVPLGPVACISPWNFPLAIFTGQVAAALAAGNVVLAKPAEQTPLAAAAAVRALHAAGVPRATLQLLPGPGETVGASLVADPHVQGVLFTGSTEVARLLQRTLATRLTAAGAPVPLIAETGGQNAMVVDSSALAEQVVGDALVSAFDSAGQRCSALRLLCVQHELAGRVVAMLEGAARELRIGDPRRLASDVGPVIDADARAGIERHVAAMQARGRRVWRAPLPAGLHGHFVAPTLIEIDDVAELEREVFGPVLHVLRYRREALPRVLAAIAATGYGLTQGVHTRIDETVAQVVQGTRAGNVYVNRNIVGAVVGVQPFGGDGLSGTGPKAGGPLYLLRLLAERPVQAARLAVARHGGQARVPVRGIDAGLASGQGGDALDALRDWAREQGLGELAAQCDLAAAESPAGGWIGLAGPTGEANLYTVRARGHVLGLAAPGVAGDADRLAQLAAALAVGAQLVWPADAQPLAERLPADVREHVTLAHDWTRPATPVDVVVHHGDAASLRRVAAMLSARPGPLVGLVGLASGDPRVPLERLVCERALSVNTAAAGGNASLMTIG